MIAKLFRQIALGLNQVHIKGLIHRDIKIENILIKMSDELD